MSADPAATNTATRERVESVAGELLALGVPLRVVAPILAHVDPSRCADCGRRTATDEDWEADYGEGERDDLCWGSVANCGIDFDGNPWA